MTEIEMVSLKWLQTSRLRFHVNNLPWCSGGALLDRKQDTSTLSVTSDQLSYNKKMVPLKRLHGLSEAYKMKELLLIIIPFHLNNRQA